MEEAAHEWDGDPNGEEHWGGGADDHDAGSDDGGFRELAAAPAAAGAALTALDFDPAVEALWAGTSGGSVVQLALPALGRHASLPAHASPVLALRSVGGGAASLCASRLCLTASGGAPRLSWLDAGGPRDLAALGLDARSHVALVGRAGGGAFTLDLSTGRAGPAIDTGGRGLVALRGPTSRGALVAATADGHLLLLDGRAGFRPRATAPAALAHAGGFAALDAADDLVATAGFSPGRPGAGGAPGRPALDRFVKVFDARMAPRMLGAIPFPPGPAVVAFAPGYAGTLLLGAASGACCFADARALAAGAGFGVDAGGDGLTAGAVSPSGALAALGGGGGYAHLWGASRAAGGSLGGPPLEPLPRAAPPAATVALTELDPLSAAPTYWPPNDEPWLASDLDPGQTVAVGLAPRVIDAALLSGMKQSDFVGYLRNPGARRGQPPGAAAAAAAPLRGARVRCRPTAADAGAAAAARAARRAAAGGAVLPPPLRRARLERERFGEHDWARWNATPYAGLENDMANAYVNAVLQALFFTPPVRAALDAWPPAAGEEFSLVCEAALLFRQLGAAAGSAPAGGPPPCQASNLLRALRASREACALGLLEGAPGERGAADIELEASLDRSLPRRAQALLRFLLERWNKEQAALLGAAAGAAGGAPPPRTPVQAAFEVALRTRARCLSARGSAGAPAARDQVREGRTFVVDLAYPPARERPPLAWAAAAQGQHGQPKGAARGGGAAGAGAVAAAAAAPPRPSFAALLASSLRTTADMRAWFDDAAGYAAVRQDRCPAGLPPVLAVACGMHDRGDLAWWQPLPGGEPWLPFALELEADVGAWAVRARGAASRAGLAGAPWAAAAAPAEALPGAPPPFGGAGVARAAYELTAVVAHVADEDEEAEWGAPPGGFEGHLVALVRVPPGYAAAAAAARRAAAARAAAGAGAGAAQQQGGGAAGEPGAGAPPPPAEAEAPGGGEWLSVNDFVLAPCPAAVVADLYGGQKAPALLLFSAASAAGWAADAAAPPAAPAPVLSPAAFLALCRAPPLQATEPRPRGGGRPPPLRPPSFVPLAEDELPAGPGAAPLVYFGIDAEFVAYSPAQRVLARGVEADARPARLGLGRVSVVRGFPAGADGEPEPGAAAGAAPPGRPPPLTPCIDDYVRSPEPVHDHLTKYSGLLPGDLDPARSPHRLATLRAAVLKLRFLAERGAVFVGHGLRKDFRMLNIVVPPEQVVDTCDLFRAGAGARRLSLRFLAAYLLRAAIQEATHDSVEDAATAVRLHAEAARLRRAGALERTVAEMYAFGKAYGWDPAAWPAAAPAAGG